MLGFKREKKDEDDILFEVSDKIDKRLTAGTPNKKKNQQGSITLSFTPRTVDVATNLNVTDRTTLVQETIKCHTASLQDTQISTEASESIASLGSSRNCL